MPACYEPTLNISKSLRLTHDWQDVGAQRVYRWRVLCGEGCCQALSLDSSGAAKRHG
ncbi:hypothetical protein FA13DRAFT_1730256 [Coprinellus micaceus]|uniref:Uncharacterized protein n=1 Tax=Coprinellus micaceus TaxID=71717 RepID=A0A4Y7TIZ2_COPMI|nr:hypothetical protein FA13DRAFT_1730256 [Coprinellus micaceus]